MNKTPPTDEEPDGEVDVPEPEVEKPDEDVLLAQLATLHAAFENEEISFDDFETQRETLLSKLHVE